VTKSPPKDIGASVRARLLRLARERGEDFQLVLTRYANERLLFRLASSRHGPRFVLKGAALFTLWTGKPHRATRDLDLLGFGDPGVDHVREVFAEMLALDVADDGVRYDLGSLAVGLIREEQEYGGVRVELVARITNAQVRLQVDVGFGDAITPEASVVEFPPLLDFPALARAIRATFERRRTPLPTTMPVALTVAFAEDSTKKTQWSGFVRKAGVRDAGSLAETIAAVRAFIEAPLASAVNGTLAPGTWRAGGAWG
jgi:hypothetical protein